MRLIIVAGKGWGKTTASAALSVAAAKCGLSVLLRLGRKDRLSRLPGEPLDYEPVECPPADTPGTIDQADHPDESLMDLADHGLKRVAKLMVAPASSRSSRPQRRASATCWCSARSVSWRRRGWPT
jgi:hypothetical protein